MDTTHNTTAFKTGETYTTHLKICTPGGATSFQSNSQLGESCDERGKN